MQTKANTHTCLHFEFGSCIIFSVADYDFPCEFITADASGFWAPTKGHQAKLRAHIYTSKCECCSQTVWGFRMGRCVNHWQTHKKATATFGHKQTISEEFLFLLFVFLFATSPSSSSFLFCLNLFLMRFVWKSIWENNSVYDSISRSGNGEFKSFRVDLFLALSRLLSHRMTKKIRNKNTRFNYILWFCYFVAFFARLITIAMSPQLRTNRHSIIQRQWEMIGKNCGKPCWSDYR